MRDTSLSHSEAGPVPGPECGALLASVAWDTRALLRGAEARGGAVGGRRKTEKVAERTAPRVSRRDVHSDRCGNYHGVPYRFGARRAEFGPSALNRYWSTPSS